MASPNPVIIGKRLHGVASTTYTRRIVRKCTSLPTPCRRHLRLELDMVMRAQLRLSLHSDDPIHGSEL